MSDLHSIQMDILKKLLFSQGLKFSEIKPSEDVENNKLVFHLDRLQELGLIIKENDLYKLTQKGKEFANRMDTDQVTMKKQAKISALCFCFRGEGDDKEVLIFTRLKQPFFGHQGFPSGKVQYGESVIEAASRELKEETTLEGTPEIAAIRHYRVYDQNTKELLEDKFMFFCKFNNPMGKLVPGDEGKYEWVKLSTLKEYFTKPFGSLDEILYELDLCLNFNGNIVLEEVEHFTDSF